MTNPQSIHLYRNGFLFHDISSTSAFAKLLVLSRELCTQPNLEYQSKQVGTATILQSVLLSYPQLVSLLFETSLYSTLASAIQLPIYLKHLKFFYSSGLTPRLNWHRDTYFHKGQLHGSIPPVYKLALYLTPTSKTSACTSFVPGSHRVDLHSRHIDKLLPYLLGSHISECKPGECILFDSSIVHSRMPCQARHQRMAIIYEFTTIPPDPNPYSNLFHKYQSL